MAGNKRRIKDLAGEHQLKLNTQRIRKYGIGMVIRNTPYGTIQPF